MIAKMKKPQPISLTVAEREINKLLKEGKDLLQILYPRKSETVPVQSHGTVEVDELLRVKISVGDSQFRRWRQNLVGEWV